MPFAEYKDFDECVKKNSDKSDPKAYCGKIKAQVEGSSKDSDKRDGNMAEAKDERTRYLDAELGSRDEFVAQGNGALVIKDIIALATGTWTDSNVRTPLHYTPKALEKDAKNWISLGIYDRHAGGSPRSILNKIGEIRNPRYSPKHQAVMVDGYLHGRTQAYKDVIQLVKDGLVTDVSVEHGGKEVWNADAKRNEAASLAFYGLAIVDKGACEVCKLKHHGACASTTEDKEMAEGESEPPANAANEAEKPVDADVLKKRIAELEAELERLKADKATEEAAKGKAEEKSAELEKKLAESEARVKELEKKPAPPASIPANRNVESDQLVEPEARVNGSMVTGEWTAAR